jgi:inorganic triphosphatase YgiF
MGAEIEAKLLADRPERLMELADAPTVGRATLGPALAFDELDVYLDTADGRLAAAGWACRLRERSGVFQVSLKGPPESDADAWVHRRPELEGPASAALDPETWPRSSARDFLDELRAGARLVERFRLQQRRTERRAVVDGDHVATLSLDRVEIIAGGTERGELLAVELELTPEGNVSILGELAAELAARPGLRPDRLTKLEHAAAVIGAA